VHPNVAYVNHPTWMRAQSSVPERDVLREFLAAEEDDGGEGYFTSYVLDEFVVYRAPDVKPVGEEGKEGRDAIKLAERGAKGQGEYELPSAVYISRGVKNLSSNSREPTKR
jgi:hypothetical protein